MSGPITRRLKPEEEEIVAAILNVDRSTLYRALAV